MFLKMPPFRSLTMIICSSPIEDRARIIANDIVKTIHKFVDIKTKKETFDSDKKSDTENNLKIIGPMEAPIKKLRNRYRWQILLKGNNNKLILYYLNFLFKSVIHKKRNELIQIDVDVHNLL